MICIVSPHLDDAALSCADHVMAWTNGGEDVLVVNVFTSVGDSAVVSPLMRASLQAAGASDPVTYAAMRAAEDRACMRALGATSVSLNFTDAGFRGVRTPDYPDLKTLRPGRLARRELDLVDATAAAFAGLGAARLVLSPLGIGGHVDHLVTRAARERAWTPALLGHYADMPYARAPWNWNMASLLNLMGARRSVKTMSAAKRAALANYRSQMPLLFRRGEPRYPEIVLFPRR